VVENGGNPEQCGAGEFIFRDEVRVIESEITRVGIEGFGEGEGNPRGSVGDEEAVEEDEKEGAGFL